MSKFATIERRLSKLDNDTQGTDIEPIFIAYVRDWSADCRDIVCVKVVPHIPRGFAVPEGYETAHEYAEHWLAENAARLVHEEFGNDMEMAEQL